MHVWANMYIYEPAVLTHQNPLELHSSITTLICLLTIICKQLYGFIYQVIILSKQLYFQVIILNAINFELYGIKYFFLIQIILRQIYLTRRRHPKSYSHSDNDNDRVHHTHKSCRNRALPQIQFSLISKKPLLEWDLNPSAQDTVSIF